MDASSLLGAALELFRARHHPGVVAACGDAVLDLPPDDAAIGPIRLLAARSLLALRRDAEAQREIRECLRIDPQCAAAYRLLGELAARADQLASAKIFLREAVRLAPDDLEAHEWLALVENMARPTAAAATIPAAKAAVGRSYHRAAPERPQAGSPDAPPKPSPGPKPSPSLKPSPSPSPSPNLKPSPSLNPTPSPSPNLEPSPKPSPSPSPNPSPSPSPSLKPSPNPSQTPNPSPTPAAAAPTRARATLPPPRRSVAPPSAAPASLAPSVALPSPRTTQLPLPAGPITPVPSVRARGTSPPPTHDAKRAPSTLSTIEPAHQTVLPAASGFGQYLVDCGLLTALQLRAALVYKRSTGVRLGAAAVVLGFVSEPKIEWASVSYHGRHRTADQPRAASS